MTISNKISYDHTQINSKNDKQKLKQISKESTQIEAKE